MKHRSSIAAAIAAFAVAGTAAAVLAAPADARRPPDRNVFAPPEITATVTCDGPFEWTLGLTIVDDSEVAYFTVQPRGLYGLTSTVTAEPGQQLVEWQLTGNSPGRAFLILAADMQGNAAKAVVEVSETYCGAQPAG